ncbi:Verru_Chthon cassette protein C [Verrucomicrobium spinosum]|uniref:Verru_Chthon cassette protein C n=1 Tax=Verrucomicrobium spinosum TaxID=2736 RepID=UPI000305F885|nr:Verru_Chthon cassette protein C [Verrucomicrobium spinosum]
MIQSPYPCSSRRMAFTLVELLVSVAVIAVLMLVLTQVLTGTQRAWGHAKARTEEYREARAVFEAISARLSQATLNSYWGYKIDASGNPVLYQRQSELHYVSGPSSILLGSQQPSSGHAVFFQAPLGENLQPGTGPAGSGPEGLDSLLNGWGWYVTYDTDLPRRPGFLASSLISPERKRFRLMEFRQPTERLSLFKATSLIGAAADALPVPWIEAQKSQQDLYQWFKTNLGKDSQPLADNILAIVVQPLSPSIVGVSGVDTSFAPAYIYDTRRHQWPDATTLAEKCRHQLPPMVRLTLVALHEEDWAALDNTKADALADQLRTWTTSKYFTAASKYDEDIKNLGADLTNLRLSHRIFTTIVQIPAAKLETSREN